MTSQRVRRKIVNYLSNCHNHFFFLFTQLNKVKKKKIFFCFKKSERVTMLYGADRVLHFQNFCVFLMLKAFRSDMKTICVEVTWLSEYHTRLESCMSRL